MRYTQVSMGLAQAVICIEIYYTLTYMTSIRVASNTENITQSNESTQENKCVRTETMRRCHIKKCKARNEGKKHHLPGLSHQEEMSFSSLKNSKAF